MSLDQKRILDHRDGFVPCYKHKNWTPWSCSTKETGRIVMGKFSKLLKYRVFQVGTVVYNTRGGGDDVAALFTGTQ